MDAASAAWDGFSESSSTASGQSQQNATIYSSMTQKLRKERGQNLDQFMSTFMQSIEQSTDVGEDVFQQSNNRDKGHAPPGKNLVFGDLFELRSPPNGKEKLNYHLHPVRGPSKCFIYIGNAGDTSQWKLNLINSPFLFLLQLLRFFAYRQC